MGFAVAVSVHPVSSQATGEVVGQLFEAVGAGADLVVVLATPGHRGALEDIAATTRRLLSPVVLLAAVTTGLGTGADYVDRGPGLAAWSGRCGPVAPVGPGRSGPAFAPTGVLLLGREVSAPPAAWPDVALVAGAVDGPVILDGAAPGPGPVGAAFGPGSGFSAVVAHGVRRLGPDLTVTRAEGTMIHELDGQPALDRLTYVARDGMPAAELSTLSARLHLRVADPGVPDPAGTDRSRTEHGGMDHGVPDGGADDRHLPTGVLGADRASGALAVRTPIATGATVHFALSDPATAGPALARAIGPTAAGALILAPPGGGRLLGSYPVAGPGSARSGSGPDRAGSDMPGPHPSRAGVPGPVLGGFWAGAGDGDGLAQAGFVDAGPPLPPATLICETASPRAASPGRSNLVTTVQAASFPLRPAPE